MLVIADQRERERAAEPEPIRTFVEGGEEFEFANSNQADLYAWTELAQVARLIR